MPYSPNLQTNVSILGCCYMQPTRKKGGDTQCNQPTCHWQLRPLRGRAFDQRSEGGRKRRTVISTQGLCGVEGGRGRQPQSLALCSSTMPFPFLNHHQRNNAAAINANHWPIQGSVNQPIDIFCLCYCEVTCNGLKLLSFLNFLEWRRREREHLQTLSGESCFCACCH